MKTMKTVFASVFAFLAVTALAVERPTMNVIRLENDKALIAIANEKPVKFELSIESAQGEVVFYKETEKELTNLRQMIDYSELKDGGYTVKLKLNDTFIATSLEIEKGLMKVGESKTTYAPYFSFNNDVLKLSYLNFDQENLTLKIYSGSFLIHEDNLGKEFTVGAGYDLSKLESGKYQVELTSSNNFFSQEIEK
jgi:hypothetical protein